MTDFAVTLKIDAVGTEQALGKVEDLSKAGQIVVDRFAKATGVSLDAAVAKYKSLGDAATIEMLKIADAAEQSAKKQVLSATKVETLMRAASLEDRRRADAAIANAERVAMRQEQMIHAAMVEDQRRSQAAIANAERELAAGAAASSALAMRNEHALAGVARGIEMVGRTGHLTGRSLDAVVGQISQMAFAFGPGGQLVAAIGISTAAIVEMFMRTSREAKRATDEIQKHIADAANAGKADDLHEQGRINFLGQPYDKDHKLVANSRFVKGAFEGSLSDLRAQLADEFDRFYKETNGFVQIRIQKEIIATKARLAPLEALNKAIGEAASNLASQPADNAGHLQGVDITAVGSDGASKRADAAARRAAAEARRIAKSVAKDAAEYQKEMLSDARDAAAQLVKDAGFRDDFLNGLLGLPSKEEQKKAIHDDMFALTQNVENAIKNDPFLRSNARSAKLGDEMGKELGEGLGRGLEAGFKAGFSGKGIHGVISAFGDSMLAALGEIFVKQGEALINFSAIMKGLHIALANPITAPWAAAAEGAALIALGVALSAAASGGGGSGGSGGSSGGGGGSYGAGLGTIIDRGVINPDSYTKTPASSIPSGRASNDTYNFYGPNDPGAVRWFDEMQKKSNQRGSLAGTG